MNLDIIPITRSERALTDTLSLEHSPPVLPTQLTCLASTMATERNVEYNQTFLNVCVLQDGPWLMTILIATPAISPAHVPQHHKLQYEGGSIPSFVW